MRDCSISGKFNEGANVFNGIKMKIFKFGGASLKSAEAVRNMASLVLAHAHEKLLIVVSAMGKTTNALEEVVNQYFAGKSFAQKLDEIKAYHLDIATALLGNDHAVCKVIRSLPDQLRQALQPGQPDEVYDQVVSHGELISSFIVHAYLNLVNLPCALLDARDYIVTDETFREGQVNWEETRKRIQNLRQAFPQRVLTQGFIGRAPNGLTTTLGREGSDFTAAIFGSCLQADSVTIWKDVPGVMSADPKHIPDAVVFPELPYKEAAEMTYYGASVIHPKTIKPLALAGIPLLVKCFSDPSLPGTRIHECHVEKLPPLIVFKENQCLISCKVVDYTFINEEHLRLIFQALSELNIRINVMQNSAISFSFCIDYRESRLLALIGKLRHHFEVYYNTNLMLITIKNYDEPTFEKYRKTGDILLEQSSRSTLQVLVRQ
jgi:aspartate kinase